MKQLLSLVTLATAARAADPTTCGDVRAAYRSEACCGNASKPFDLDALRAGERALERAETLARLKKYDGMIFHIGEPATVGGYVPGERNFIDLNYQGQFQLHVDGDEVTASSLQNEANPRAPFRTDLVLNAKNSTPDDGYHTAYYLEPASRRAYDNLKVNVLTKSQIEAIRQSADPYWFEGNRWDYLVVKGVLEDALSGRNEYQRNVFDAGAAIEVMEHVGREAVVEPETFQPVGGWRFQINHVPRTTMHFASDRDWNFHVATAADGKTIVTMRSWGAHGFEPGDKLVMTSVRQTMNQDCPGGWCQSNQGGWLQPPICYGQSGGVMCNMIAENYGCHADPARAAAENCHTPMDNWHPGFKTSDWGILGSGSIDDSNHCVVLESVDATTVRCELVARVRSRGTADGHYNFHVGADDLKYYMGDDYNEYLAPVMTLISRPQYTDPDAPSYSILKERYETHEFDIFLHLEDDDTLTTRAFKLGTLLTPPSDLANDLKYTGVACTTITEIYPAYGGSSACQANAYTYSTDAEGRETVAPSTASNAIKVGARALTDAEIAVFGGVGGKDYGKFVRVGGGQNWQINPYDGNMHSLLEKPGHYSCYEGETQAQRMAHWPKTWKELYPGKCTEVPGNSLVFWSNGGTSGIAWEYPFAKADDRYAAFLEFWGVKDGDMRQYSSRGERVFTKGLPRLPDTGPKLTFGLPEADTVLDHLGSGVYKVLTDDWDPFGAGQPFAKDAFLSDAVRAGLAAFAGVDAAALEALTQGLTPTLARYTAPVYKVLTDDWDPFGAGQPFAKDAFLSDAVRAGLAAFAGVDAAALDALTQGLTPTLARYTAPLVYKVLTDDWDPFGAGQPFAKDAFLSDAVRAGLAAFAGVDAAALDALTQGLTPTLARYTAPVYRVLTDDWDPFGGGQPFAKDAFLSDAVRTGLAAFAGVDAAALDALTQGLTPTLAKFS